MNSRLRKIESRSSFSRLLALNQKAGFADKKVIICVLCFNQFVVYSMPLKSCHLSGAPKDGFLPKYIENTFQAIQSTLRYPEDI